MNEKKSKNTNETIDTSQKNNNILRAVLIFILFALLFLTLLFIPNEITDSPTFQTSNLQSVDNFENLYSILQDSPKNTNIIYEDSVGELSPDSFAPSDTSSNSSTSSDFSTTNIQVQGVDEADIVKTNGNYIFYAIPNRVIIADIQDNTNIKIASEIELGEDTSTSELFLNDDTLVIIYTIYDGSYYEYSSSTITKTYDISNPYSPRLKREVSIEGDYLNSRMIENDIYILATQNIYSNNLPNKTPSIYEEKHYIPNYMDSAISSKDSTIPYNCIYPLPYISSTSYLTIASFNIENSNKANIATYIGTGETVYMSENNLYIVGTEYISGYDDFSILPEIGIDIAPISTTYKTHIFKFSLNDGIASFDTETELSGKILNQFSLDEYNGNLRIAITDYNETDTNNLYILDSNLNEIGSIKNLAPGESIYSARFMGDKAYMVTFVEVDPLFVLDLKDPTNPKVLGELKIPGYSSYLHPYDENHLIGFGYDTEITSYGSVVNTSFKMALFNVTDPTNPKELFVEKIGEKGTSSELLNNHKALLFSKEKNLLAFPINIENNYYSSYQGVVIYNINPETGFTKQSSITHFGEDTKYYDYENEIERIIYANNAFYTLSENMIKSTDMSNFTLNSSLDIELYDPNDFMPLWDY